MTRPALPNAPNWPALDEKSQTYTLSAADGSAWLVFVGSVRTYIEQQLERCAERK